VHLAARPTFDGEDVRVMDDAVVQEIERKAASMSSPLNARGPGPIEVGHGFELLAAPAPPQHWSAEQTINLSTTTRVSCAVTI